MRVIKQHLWVFCTLLGIMVLAGIRTVSIPVITHVPAIALFPAVGIPTLIPPFRFTPLGHVSVDYWLIDIIGVVVLLLAMYVHLSRSSERVPNPSRRRSFFTAMTATTMGLLAANIVRMVLQTVQTDSSFGSYVGSLLGTAIISLIVGLVIGLVVGIVAAISPRKPSEQIDVVSSF